MAAGRTPDCPAQKQAHCRVGPKEVPGPLNSHRITVWWSLRLPLCTTASQACHRRLWDLSTAIGALLPLKEGNRPHPARKKGPRAG